MDDVSEVVAACCVLHNICEVKGDEDWAEDVEEVGNVSSASSCNITQPSSDSIAIRNAYMQYFCQQ